MDDTDLRNKISKAKARMLLQHPFFATLLLRTPVVITTDVQLAATDGENMYFNPDFLAKLTVEDTVAVEAHEVGHDSLLHSFRLGAKDPDLWNQACDHAINLMLESQGFKAPKAVPGGWLADPQYKGWSADRIYDDLRRKKNPPSGGGGKSGKGGSPGGGKPGNNPGGKDWLHGDVLPTKKQGDEAVQAQNRAKQRVAAAATAARMAGKMSGDLARMVDDVLETKVHWTDVLRTFMTRIVKARDNWARRNRRFRSLYLPTRHTKQMGPILFIPDTSGSMFGDDLEKICSEMHHCAAQTKPENIRVVWADSKVKSEQVFQPQDFSFSALKPVGGGGTDMRVALAYVEQYDPQVVVLCTDGFTPWGNPTPYPLIILCTTTQPCPDWAEVIRI